MTGEAEFSTLLGEAARSRPGGNGLLTLPYFAGERTPVADPEARGVIAGLTLSHTRGDIYRSLLEATAFGVRHNLAAFTAIGAEPTRVVAVGGGAGDPIWPQIVPDVTGFAQDIPTETIGASYGDAHFAAIALGADPGAGWNSVRRRIEPDSAATALYDVLFADYLELRDATTDIQHRLARRQR